MKHINDIITKFIETRNKTVLLIHSLNNEDMNVQTFSFVSPTKWHLAHTTWFYEKFILENFNDKYNFYDKNFNYIFNSYYNSAGNIYPRDKRGFLSRPCLDEVLQYRKIIEDKVIELLEKKNIKDKVKLLFLIELGINHEQQHQELILTDILNVFFHNPTKPIYQKKNKLMKSKNIIQGWTEVGDLEILIGNEGEKFCYDNELPLHEKKIKPFKIQNYLINNYDWKCFIDDDGYNRSEFWLSDGYEFIKKNKINKPLYWIDKDLSFSLNGVKEIDEYAPVSHISFYEADAFARWKNKRLPSEFEIEYFLKKNNINGNFLESKNLEPQTLGNSSNSVNQLYGDVWEWTSTNYHPYEGYRTWEGPVGEYNGKFMCNQFVLKGGSCVTPIKHIRSSYRNFFYPYDRWQFNGLRLAESINEK